MKTLVLIVFLGLSAGLAQQRVLSLDLEESSFKDFGTVMAEAQQMGVSATKLFLHWSNLESTGGVYTFDQSYLWAAQYYNTQNISLIFYVNPINTNVRETPPDLLSTDWTDPQMISRYLALLDTIVTYLGDETLYFAIGNEVDAYLTDSASYAKYKTFYDTACTHLKSLRPNIQVGIASQLRALYYPPSRQWLQSLNERSDVWIGTYYGTDADSVIEPAAMAEILDSCLSWIGDKPLVISEIGYPTSSYLKSSELKQADFVTAVFDYWNTHADRIPFINFMKQWEWSPAEVQGFTDYYGFADTAFIEFLATLGMHDTLGDPKLAWTRLQQEAGEAGFAGSLRQVQGVNTRPMRVRKLVNGRLYVHVDPHVLKRITVLNAAGQVLVCRELGQESGTGRVNLEVPWSKQGGIGIVKVEYLPGAGNGLSR